MTAVRDLLAKFQGYRTYAAAIAAMLVSLAGLAGLLHDGRAQKLTLACIALAVVFSRVAQAGHALSLANIERDLADVAAAVQPPPNPPPELNLFVPDSRAA